MDKQTKEVEFVTLSDEFISGGYEKLKIATDNYKKYIDNKEFYEQSYINNLEL